ncbi:hypothetical protein GCM10027589_34090 [Actinocorallia lasiicapitis]
MTSSNRPRLAVIVANGITGDSRVQKSALAAARDGWDVTLIGRSPTDYQTHSSMGAVEIIRVPVQRRMRTRAARSKTTTSLRSLVAKTTAAELAEYESAHRAWVREQSARIGWTYSGSQVQALDRVARRAWIKVRGKAHASVVSLSRKELRKAKAERRPSGDWREDWPELLDLELAFGPVIEKLAPDLIHANDITMIGVAAHSAARLRARGRSCAWIYDAHEYVRGVDWPTPMHTSAYIGVENEFIGRADAVVTVSPEIAELIRDDHRLPGLPLVVRNTPIRSSIGASEVSVRAAAGVAEDVPLLVYSGWMARERGVGTAVAALTELPEVHLALVSGFANKVLDELLIYAKQLGVDERIHVVPYVPQHAVPDYLSSADIGLICSQRTMNYEISLPTKLAEYLHAGLPLVTSDVRTVKAYVEGNGVGVTFTADDPVAFAKAVREALDSRAELAANITEPLLAELSWEQQSGGLLELYRELSARTPEETREELGWEIDEVAWRGRAERSKHGWVQLSATPVRLGLAPANYAGQLGSFAKAVTDARPDVSAEVLMVKRSGSFGYPADFYLNPAHLKNPARHPQQVARVVDRYTHLIADAFQPVFGTLNGDSIADDLPMLDAAGIKVALLAHGSEIRHPQRHLASSPHSHYRNAPPGELAVLTAIAERNQRIARESGLPVFVTTPDLLDDLPDAVWAPLVVDVDHWACDRPVMERARPIVLHAPSRRWTKGTDLALPILSELHERGRIELRLAEKESRKRMRELIWDADILVDQFGVGAYGVLACEGMAAGKPVIARITDEVRRVVDLPLPVVDATIDTLREAVLRLVDDREGTAAIGARSLEYVRTVHDGRRTAEVLGTFLT